MLLVKMLLLMAVCGYASYRLILWLEDVCDL